jgi:putative copper export protein
MATFYHLSVFFHLLCAIVWLGGMLFLAIIVVPIIRKPEYRQFSAMFFHQTGLKFRLIGWICLGVFLVTGVFNLFYRLRDWGGLFTSQFWSSVFGETLLIKLFFFFLIVIISAIHDFFIGPKATVLWQQNPTSAEAKNLRKSASWLGRINLLAGLIVLYLAIAMVRGVW